MPKKALGKGLEALLPRLSQSQSQRVIELDLDLIDANPNQPRKNFDQERLEELAQSIKATGILQPVIVQQHENRYTIVIGERRVRASRLAGLKAVPALIKEFSDTSLLQIALIENIQRQDLNPIEQATAFQELLEQHQVTQEDLAERVGKNRSFIANTVRLLKLTPAVKQKIETGILSPGHARNLVAIHDPKEQENYANRIIAEAWTVRQTEKYFKKQRRRKTKLTRPENDPHLIAMREQLIRYLGTKVNLVTQTGGGQIVISFYNHEDLTRIYDLITKKRSS